MVIQSLNAHPQPYVTLGELATYWGVGRKLLRKQIHARSLHAIKLGPRAFRVSIREALRFEAEARLCSVPPKIAKADLPAPKRMKRA